MTFKFYLPFSLYNWLHWLLIHPFFVSLALSLFIRSFSLSFLFRSFISCLLFSPFKLLQRLFLLFVNTLLPLVCFLLIVRHRYTKPPLTGSITSSHFFSSFLFQCCLSFPSRFPLFILTFISIALRFVLISLSFFFLLSFVNPTFLLFCLFSQSLSLVLIIPCLLQN